MGDLPAADPKSDLPGSSGNTGDLPTTAKDSKDADELRAAQERIFGSPPKETTAGVATKKTNRYEQFLKSKLKKTKADLEPENPGSPSKDSKSDEEDTKAEASSNQSFAEHTEEAYGPTPDEAWQIGTPLSRKFQTYARRVV